jgi:hypothetical protein
MTRDDLHNDAPDFAQPQQGKFDLEGIRKRLGFGQVNLSNPQAWLDANQDVAYGTTITGGKMFDSSGRFLADVIGKHKAGGTTSQFLDGIDSNTGKVRAPKAAPTFAQPAAPAAAASAGAGASAGNDNTYLQQIREMINAQIGKMGATPSITDPELAAQSNAYRRARERSGQDARAALAQRAAANGLLLGGNSSGSFDVGVQGIHEGIGEDTAAHDAGLVGDEVQQRRATLQGLLNMALSSGDAESVRALQLQLAQMDEALRKQQMAQQSSQFNANLAQQGRQFDAGLGFDRYRYDDTMGFNQARSAEDDYRYRVNLGLGV